MVTLRATNDSGVKVDLDIIQSSDILLDISAIESTEIGKVFGVSSQEFALPGTEKNQQFFGYLDNLGTTPGIGLTKTLPCQVLYNGAEVFTGKLYVNNIITDQHGDTIYNVVVVNETVDFKYNVQNLYLGDLDWSQYNHTLTYTNISSSFNDNLFSGDIVYPLVNYGFDAKDPLATEMSAGGGNKQFDNKDFPLRVTDFKPAIKAKAVIDKIFETTNYTYSSSFFDSAYFDSLYILSTQDDKNGYTFVNPVSQSILAQNSSGQPFANIVDHKVVFGNEVYDNSGNWDPSSNSRYTAFVSGSYTFYTTLGYTTNGTASAAGPDLLEIYFLKNGTVDIGSTTINIKGKRSGTVYCGPVVANLNPTDYVEVWVRREHLGSNTLEIVAGNRSKIQVEGPGSPIGGTVNVGKIFDPKAKVLDVLNGFIQQFNLVVEPIVGSRNVLRIEPFNTWIDNGSVVDWTDKVDRGTKFEITHPLQSQPKKLIFSNQEDTDVLNKYTKDKFDKTYGEYIYESDSDLADGERQIGTFFAATPLKGINGAPMMVMPILAQKESSEAETPFKFKPRLLHKIGMVDADNLLRGYNPTSGAYSYGTYYIKDDAGVSQPWDQYMLFHHLSSLPADFDTTLDLHFGNTNHWSYHQNEFNAKTKNSAFFTYWSFYVNELYDVDARLLTCNVYLNPVEIQSIKLNDKVFIDGHYYRINKISGANLLNPASVKVELLKTLPRKLYYPRRRIIDTYTGEPVYDVYADWSTQNFGGVIEYKDYETGEVFTSSIDLGKVAPKDNFTLYGENVIWNTVGASTPEFVATSIRGNNDVDTSVDKAYVTGDNNTVKAAVNKVSVLGNNNIVSEYNEFVSIDGSNNILSTEVSNVSLTNANNTAIAPNSSELTLLNVNGTEVTGSKVAVVGDVNSTINASGSFNNVVFVGTRETTISGSFNDTTVIGTEQINITGGNYHVVIGKDNEVTSTLDLNRYRSNTNVLNGTYLDDDIYLNRDGLDVTLYNGQIYYAYSGDALYKYIYNVDFDILASGSGTATIELPGISSQDQFGRSILFKCSGNISSSSTVYITSIAGTDDIDGAAVYTLNSPYAWVELRASQHYDASIGGFINEWQIIRSDSGNGGGGIAGPVAYGSFFSNLSESIATPGVSQSVTLNSTYESQSVALSGSSKIKFDYQGTYEFQYVAQVANSTNAVQDANFWIKYNGVDYPDSNTRITLQPRKSSGEPSFQLMTSNFIGTAQNDGDYIELFWNATDAGVYLFYTGSNGEPATPSVIANVHSVSGGGPTYIISGSGGGGYSPFVTASYAKSIYADNFNSIVTGSGFGNNVWAISSSVGGDGGSTLPTNSTFKGNFILGGSNGTVYSYAPSSSVDYNTIVGGGFTTIGPGGFDGNTTSGSYHSNGIFNAWDSAIDSQQSSSNSLVHYNTIVGGNTNIITDFYGTNMQYNLILSGYENTVKGGERNVIIGGNNNTLTGSNNVVLLGCVGVTGSQDNTTYTENFEVQQTASLDGFVTLSKVSASLNFANDTAAAAGGVPLGGLYRNGNVIQIRLA